MTSAPVISFSLHHCEPELGVTMMLPPLATPTPTGVGDGVGYTADTVGVGVLL